MCGKFAIMSSHHILDLYVHWLNARGLGSVVLIWIDHLISVMTLIGTYMQPVSPPVVKVSIVGELSDEYFYGRYFLMLLCKGSFILSFFEAIFLSLSFIACHLTRHRV